MTEQYSYYITVITTQDLAMLITPKRQQLELWFRFIPSIQFFSYIKKILKTFRTNIKFDRENRIFDPDSLLW